MQANVVSRLLGVVICLLILHGCSQAPERTLPPTDDPLSERAAESMAAGDFLAAANLYRQLATTTTDPALRSSYLLAATEAAAQGGDWDGVRESVALLQGYPFGSPNDLRYRILGTELMLREMRPLDAIDVLGASPGPEVPNHLAIRYFRVLARTYRQMGNLLESANALQQVDALLTDIDERLATQTEILRTLVLLNDMALERLQPSPPGVPGGWMQLALLVKQHGDDRTQFDPLYADWRARFPQHPALPELLSNYTALRQQQMLRADRVAVLLPLSGPLAGASAALRDGMMLQHLDDGEQRTPRLRFYDSSDPALTWPTYKQAVADGAELVIGPLQKDAVDQLVRAGELPVPVLALNEVALTRLPPENLFMYSLSPEDEARQVAEKAWLDGIRRPLVLVPQGDWGERIASAYQDRWQTLGGDIAGTGRYDSSAHDFSATIKTLLHLDQSVARHQEMQKWLGKRVEFEPRRREDVDAIFLAARPIQAQGMRPQLQFHRAADLPVYATSHAWSGRLSRNQAEDLRGILLPDIPWLVQQDRSGLSQSTVAEFFPASGSALGRLYAMGMDAVKLAPHLGRLRSSRFEALEGATGNLYMDEQQRVRRQLVWLRLDEEPEIIGFAPRLDLQEQSIEIAPLQPDETEPAT
jgi:outer membrane PBP1 activator LpoA protein